MKADIKARWVERLRSGQDEQGTGYLDYTDNDDVTRKCCLGVLSAIAVEDGVIPEPDSYLYEGGPHTTIYSIYTYDAGHTSVLPPTVMEWAGITDCEGMFNNPTIGHNETLAGLNDSGMTFVEIADVIEKHF